MMLRDSIRSALAGLRRLNANISTGKIDMGVALKNAVNLNSTGSSIYVLFTSVAVSASYPKKTYSLPDNYSKCIFRKNTEAGSYVWSKITVGQDIEVCSQRCTSNYGVTYYIYGCAQFNGDSLILHWKDISSSESIDMTFIWLFGIDFD